MDTQPSLTGLLVPSLISSCHRTLPFLAFFSGSFLGLIAVFTQAICCQSLYSAL